MNDIAAELAKLHILIGAEYSRQVEKIARMNVFHPILPNPSRNRTPDFIFERYNNGIEVVVFRGNKKISVTRQTIADRIFVVTFSKKYYK